jgi:hypothetical protein
MRPLRMTGNIAMAWCFVVTATLGTLTWSASAQGAGNPAVKGVRLELPGAAGRPGCVERT